MSVTSLLILILWFESWLLFILDAYYFWDFMKQSKRFKYFSSGNYRFSSILHMWKNYWFFMILKKILVSYLGILFLLDQIYIKNRARSFCFPTTALLNYRSGLQLIFWTDWWMKILSDLFPHSHHPK